MKAVDIIRASVTTCPIPSYIKEKRFPIRFYFSNKNSFKTVLCSREYLYLLFLFNFF